MRIYLFFFLPTTYKKYQITKIEKKKTSLLSKKNLNNSLFWYHKVDEDSEHYGEVGIDTYSDVVVGAHLL